MNKQEFKILSGLVRSGNVRLDLLSSMGVNVDRLSIGRYYEDFPPALPSTVLKAHNRAVRIPGTAAFNGVFPRPKSYRFNVVVFWAKYSGDYGYFKWDFMNPLLTKG